MERMERNVKIEEGWMQKERGTKWSVKAGNLKRGDKVRRQGQENGKGREGRMVD
jgi:hypothetical protein